MIDLKEDPEAAVGAMLRYLYNHSYESCKEESKLGPAEFDATMYFMGTYYEVPNLEAAGKQAFLTGDQNITTLDVESLKSILRIIYQKLPDTDSTLRTTLLEAVIKTSVSEWDNLCSGQAEQLFVECPRFAVDLMHKCKFDQSSRNLDFHTTSPHRCPACLNKVYLPLYPTPTGTYKFITCPVCMDLRTTDVWHQCLIID